MFRTAGRLLLALTLALPACERVAPVSADRASHVRDDAGREVALAAPARRIVSLVPAVTDIVVALGAHERLVARTDYDTDAGLASLPSVGGGLDPNLEWLAARRPDLVIGWTDRQSRSVIARLADLGTASYAAEIETVADVRHTIRRLGTLLDLDARADSLIADIDASLAHTAAATARHPPVAALYVVGLDPLIVAGPGTFIHELLEIAGASNLAGDAAVKWPHLSLEELVTSAPDVVFLATGPSAAAASRRLHATPVWSRVPAVRTGRVVVVDAAVFNRPGPAVARIAAEFAASLHAPQGAP